MKNLDELIQNLDVKPLHFKCTDLNRRTAESTLSWYKILERKEGEVILEIVEHFDSSHKIKTFDNFTRAKDYAQKHHKESILDFVEEYILN